MAKLILILLIFYLPLIVVPQLRLAFEFPKVVLAEVCIETLLILKILEENKSFLDQFRKKQLILAGSLILLSLIHLISNFNTENFFGNIFRLQGVVLLWHLILLSLLTSTYKSLKIQLWILFIPLIFLVSSIFVLGQNSAHRYYGTLGEPNSFAATALVFFPFIFLSNRKIFKASILGLTLIILVFAKSYSGYIAFLSQILFLILSQKTKLSFSKSFAICLILVVLTCVLPFTGFRRDLGAESSGSVEYENRSEIWQTAFQAGLQKPLLGWGFGNVETALKKTAWDLQNSIRFQTVDSSHNFLLDYWIEGGIAGLLIIFSLLYHSIKNLVRAKKTLELTVLLAILTAMLFNPVSIGILIVFWWIIGRSFATFSSE